MSDPTPRDFGILKRPGHNADQVHVVTDNDGLAVVGRTLADIRGHRFMSDPAPAPAPAEPTPAPTPETAAPTAPAAAAPAGGDRTPLDQLPPDVQEYVRTLRNEAKTYREERDQFKGQIDTLTPAQQQLEALRAMVAGEGKTAPTAEELQTQFQQAQTEATQAKQEADAAKRGLALVRVASLPDVQVNASRLLDSKSFEAKLAQIDPADDAALRALLTAEAEADQSLRIVPIAGGSGGGAHGGATPTTGRLSLKDAIAARNKQQGTPGR